MRSFGLAIALALAVAVPAASAANSRSLLWSRVDGPTKAGTQLGLLRSGGVLHVVWAQGSPAAISDTEVNGDGKSLKTVPIASNFDGIGGMSLVGMADGSVRLFVAGGTRPGLPSNLSGINSFVAPPGADGWTLDPTALWGGAVASAADEIGATVSGGNPITAYSAGFVHVGLGPSSGSDPSYQPDCCGVAPQLATDGSSGAVVMSWLSNGHQSGTYVKQVFPSQGALVSLPSSMNVGSSGIAARLGAPGTFVAYTGPTNQVIKLYQYGGGTRTIVKGPYRIAKVFAGPAGRLWMLWGDANSGVWATRSNKAVTKWEPVQKVALPKNVTAFYNAQGEGSAGPLDAFVDLLIGTNDRGFWRTHVPARDSLTESTSNPSGGAKGKSAKLAFHATDAGDPLTGAIIVVARGGTVLARLKTDPNGRASMSLILGNLHGSTSLKATVTAPGYAPQTISVRLRG
jgi:hypothetical protein